MSVNASSPITGIAVCESGQLHHFIDDNETNAHALNVAIQMDPVDTLDISGDTTFALSLEAQARGHISGITPERLSYEQGHYLPLVRP